MSLDLPINEPKIETVSNIYEWIFPVDAILNLAICFLPGVKSKIIQNENGIHIKINTCFIIDLIHISYNHCCLYKYINENIISGKILLRRDCVLNIYKNTAITPLVKSLTGMIIIGCVVMFYDWMEDVNKLLSVDVIIDSKKLTFTNISIKRYQDKWEQPRQSLEPPITTFSYINLVKTRLKI